MSFLTACFRKSATTPTPYEPTVTAPYAEIYAILYGEYTRELKVLATDSNYVLLDRALIEAFLKDDHTDRTPYKAESHDCDDYALETMVAFRKWFHARCPGYGVGFGFMSGDLRPPSKPDTKRSHAMCCYIDVHHTLWAVEPQNDKIFQLAPTSTIRYVMI
jgi:hypothetical protein